MAERAPNAVLLASLARLVRGLSALFWGLPAALVLAVQTVKGEWFKAAGWIPVLIATGLLLYGTHLLEAFQPQERIWRHAVDRARLISIVNVGLAPFLFFWSRVTASPFFTITVEMLILTSLVYLYLLNTVLARLAAMLPDETLRGETRVFTRLNQLILIVFLVLLPIYFVLHQLTKLPRLLVEPLLFIERGGAPLQFAALLVFVLLPVAMTMALLWKTKEVILAGVFSGPEAPPPS
jgi:hypothetical protein